MGTQATLALCLGAFIDLISNHDEASTGESTVDKVWSFIDEVNTVLGEDRNSKHSFAMQLSKQTWFTDNYLEVRYQPGKNYIIVTHAGMQGMPGKPIGGPMQWAQAAQSAMTNMWGQDVA